MLMYRSNIDPIGVANYDYQLIPFIFIKRIKWLLILPFTRDGVAGRFGCFTHSCLVHDYELYYTFATASFLKKSLSDYLFFKPSKPRNSSICFCCSLIASTSTGITLV
jgi:hypothetical protein